MKKWNRTRLNDAGAIIFLMLFISFAVICWGMLGPHAGMWMVGTLFLCFLFLFFGVDPRITWTIGFMFCLLQSCHKEPLGFGDPLNNYEYFTADIGNGINSESNNEDYWYGNPVSASWLWLSKRIDQPRIQDWLKRHNLTEEELLEIGKYNSYDWQASKFYSKMIDEDEYNKYMQEHIVLSEKLQKIVDNN